MTLSNKEFPYTVRMQLQVNLYTCVSFYKEPDIALSIFIRKNLHHLQHRWFGLTLAPLFFRSTLNLSQHLSFFLSSSRSPFPILNLLTLLMESKYADSVMCGRYVHLIYKYRKHKNKVLSNLFYFFRAIYTNMSRKTGLCLYSNIM